jgi:glycosyltransferase involved in cell wall biosynthesis
LAGQSKAIKHAACFHATAEHEFQDIRRAGFNQPVCVIPNGVGISRQNSTPLNSDGRRRLLFLGRIHPVKGIDVLLRAWAAVYANFSGWDLEIVGSDSGGYLAELQGLALSLKLERVTFNGPLFGQDKTRCFEKADLYVLPSHSENFGMTVAEAMAAGTPVITTHCTPWSGLEVHGAGWWIESGLDSLVACLEQAMESPSENLALMGKQGRQWMEQEFSWSEAAHKMEQTYQWLTLGGDKPTWVKC